MHRLFFRVIHSAVILRCSPPLRGEPRRMGHRRKWRSFETPRKRAAPQDDGRTRAVIARSTCDEAIQSSLCCVLDCFAEPVIGPAKPDPFARNDGASQKTLRIDIDL